MLRSIQLRKYLVKFFMRHSKGNLHRVAVEFVADVTSKCFLNEEVLLKEHPGDGIYVLCKIIKEKSRILIRRGDREREVAPTDVTRAVPITQKDVQWFLATITHNTPFGPILIENVFDTISNPNFIIAAMSSTSSDRTPTDPYEHPLRYTERHSLFRQPNRAVKSAKFVIENDLDEFEEITLFKGRRLTRFVRVAHFISSHASMLGITFNLGLFESMIYNMDNIPLLVQVIRGLIDYINHDSFVVKAKHFNTVRAYASRLLASYPVPDETEGIEELKPIQEINLDNYRSQFRHFINNLIYVYDLRALVKFNGCFNKAAIDIRLDVLELLIGLINITDLYREFVQEQTVIMKKVRALQDAVAVRKRGETANQSEMSAMGRELDEIGLNHIRSPIRAFLGRFSEYALVYFDRSVVLAINESKAYAFRKREQLQQFMGTIDRKHRGGRLLHSNLSDLVSLSGMTN